MRAKRGGRASASIGGPSLLGRLRFYFEHHAETSVESLRRLAATPVSSAMTVAVIGIALALPLGLYVILANLQQVSSGWDGSAQISLFLELEASEQRTRELAEQVESMPGVASVRSLSREQALEEFKALSGFGEALELLESNPLPPVVVVQATPSHGGPQAVDELVSRLRALEGVDRATLDLQWVKRLYTLMEIGQRGVLVVAALLGLAVLLAVGNTVRLEIQNRRDEIVITKLIGATDGFIRRPFLYSGLWYGLLGGMVAWLLVQSALGVIAGPVRALAGTYGSSFLLGGVGPGLGLLVLGLGAGLGLAGSWLAVGRHLSAIEPT